MPGYDGDDYREGYDEGYAWRKTEEAWKDDKLDNALFIAYTQVQGEAEFRVLPGGQNYASVAAKLNPRDIVFPMKVLS